MRMNRKIIDFVCSVSTVAPGRRLLAPLMRRWEVLDIVDEQGGICGAAPRKRVHGDNRLMHRVVHVIITDREGRILLQKRSKEKNVAPGKWDTSVGGHVDYAETVECAMRREMAEELGLSPEFPKFAYSYIHSNNFESELVFTYVCGSSEQPQPNFKEIDELRFWSPAEINAALDGPDLSENFKDEFRRFMNWKASENDTVKEIKLQ